MTGPYRFRVLLRDGGSERAVADLPAESAIRDAYVSKQAERYAATDLYSPGGGPLINATRAATVFAAVYCTPVGATTVVEIRGRVSGKDAVLCRTEVVRRVSETTVETTLGSKFNERRFLFPVAGSTPVPA